MKTNLFKRTIVLLVLVSITIFSKGNSDLRLKYLHYENSLGEKGITTFYYSEDGKNYKQSGNYWMEADIQ